MNSSNNYNLLHLLMRTQSGGNPTELGRLTVKYIYLAQQSMAI